MDFRRSFASGDQRIFCKRASLSHEQEVRAVLPNNNKVLRNGKLVVCDLTELIEEVIISPFAPSWFGNVLNETLKRFEYKFQVRQSEISDEPFF
jgi:hypothetical protein